jgi:hypothetical protein
MRRILLLAVAATALGSCERADPASISLAGTWDVEIVRGHLPWTRTTVRGQLRLAATDFPGCGADPGTPRAESPLCHTYVTGSYSIPLDSLRLTTPYGGWSPTAEAMVFGDGEISLTLSRCCDHGEVFAEGRISGDRIFGGWYQRFFNGGPGGRFVMRRASAPAP